MFLVFFVRSTIILFFYILVKGETWVACPAVGELEVLISPRFRPVQRQALVAAR